MKPIHTTLFLALVFIGLGAYVYLIELPEVEQEIVQETAKRRILPFDDREVLRLTMTSKDETVVMTRDSRYRWHIQKPIQSKADSRAVQSLLRALTIGKVLRVIQTQDRDLKEYGLNPPHITLALETDQHSDTILLGNVDPISDNLYAQRLSDGQILLTTLVVQDFRTKSLFTFRRKRIFPFDRLGVTEFRLQYGGSDFVLTQIPSAHGMSGDWIFQSPFKGPADKTAVNVCSWP